MTFLSGESPTHAALCASVGRVLTKSVFVFFWFLLSWPCFPLLGLGNVQLLSFIDNKSSCMYHQKKKAAQLRWTLIWRRNHKKSKADTVAKKKAKKTVKIQRAVGGMSLEDLKKKKAEKPQVRVAAQEAALRYAAPPAHAVALDPPPLSPRPPALVVSCRVHGARPDLRRSLECLFFSLLCRVLTIFGGWAKFVQRDQGAQPQGAGGKEEEEGRRRRRRVQVGQGTGSRQEEVNSPAAETDFSITPQPS